MVTGHFVPNRSTRIESVSHGLIDCSEIEHSAVQYAKKIREAVIEKFELDKNNITVVGATTDNAANMIATAAELKIKWMPCYAHTLQLVINDILFPKKKVLQTETTADEEFQEAHWYALEL